jgi:hypothetical protein
MVQVVTRGREDHDRGFQAHNLPVFTTTREQCATLTTVGSIKVIIQNLNYLLIISIQKSGPNLNQPSSTAETVKPPLEPLPESAAGLDIPPDIDVGSE